MSSHSARSSRSSARPVDRESRKPRVSAKIRPVSPIYEESGSDSQSEKDALSAEEFDDTVRPKTSKKKTSVKKPQVSKPKKVAPNTEELSDREELSDDSTPSSIAPHLALLLTSTAHLSLQSASFPSVSQFIPSAFNFYYVLEAVHKFLFDNRYLRKIISGYHPLLTRYYYGVLFYVQILRARHFAGNLTKAEGKFLRFFEKTYPLESLPVMSPLAGFFELLGSVKLSDPRYNYVIPALPTIAADHTVNHGFGDVAGRFLIPDLPGMYMLMYTMSKKKASLKAENLSFIKGTATGHTDYYSLFIDLQFDEAALSCHLSAPGFSYLDYGYDDEDAKLIGRFLGKMNLPEMKHDSIISSCEQFTRLGVDDQSTSWFNQIIGVAAAEAKFFKGSANLTSFSPSADLSLLIETAIPHSDVEALTTDNLKTLATLEKRFESIDLYKPSALRSLYTRCFDTSEQQFQLGAACGYITVSVQDDGTSATSPKFSSLSSVTTSTKNYAGPYFTSDNERLASKNQEFIENSCPPLCKHTQTKVLPVSNIESFIVGNLYLEKGKE